MHFLETGNFLNLFTPHRTFENNKKKLYIVIIFIGVIDLHIRIRQRKYERLKELRFPPGL